MIKVSSHFDRHFKSTELTCFSQLFSFVTFVVYYIGGDVDMSPERTMQKPKQHDYLANKSIITSASKKAKINKTPSHNRGPSASDLLQQKRGIRPFMSTTGQVQKQLKRQPSAGQKTKIFSASPSRKMQVGKNHNVKARRAVKKDVEEESFSSGTENVAEPLQVEEKDLILLK